MLKISRQVGNNDRENIQGDKTEVSETAEDRSENVFYRSTEKIKGEHIQQQMHMILMDESRSDKPVVLDFTINLVWVHDERSHKAFIFPGQETDDNGYAKEHISDEHAND